MGSPPVQEGDCVIEFINTLSLELVPERLEGAGEGL